LTALGLEFCESSYAPDAMICVPTAGADISVADVEARALKNYKRIVGASVMDQVTNVP
jgi:hypothetical protein